VLTFRGVVGENCPARHAVIEIIDGNEGDVHIAPGGMDQVIAANGNALPVPAMDQHGELRTGQFDPCGKG
jgi:hypothetical protein